MTNGTPSPTHNIRKPFDKNLYVEREEELRLAQIWRNSKKRVLTVTSPPAQGKSWFLGYLWYVLRNENVPVFFIDITQFLLSGPLGSREIKQEAQQQWLSNFANSLREQCPETPSINEDSEIKSNLSILAKEVVIKCWPQQPIYLVVDGGDEPSYEAFKKIEKEILEPIMTAHQNWRLIVAVREQQRLISYFLRQTEERLILSTLSDFSTSISLQGREQLQLLHDNTLPPSPTVDEVVALLSDYSWSHPGLNTFLYEEARETMSASSVPRLRKQLIERGICELIQAKTLEEVASLINQLRAIQPIKSNPDVEWTLEDLVIFLNISRSEAWIIVQPLLKYHLILSVSNRYKIADGVREFVKAAGSLE